jgi:N-acyl-L-homoserine lactone synthetase
MSEPLQTPTWKDVVKHPHLKLIIEHAKFGLATTILGILTVVACVWATILRRAFLNLTPGRF